tara:strand:- start:82 stop:579 length:498 start_codon:yes stop_codon:yes gene_type:complete
MKSSLYALASALFVLAACETPPADEGTVDGVGNSNAPYTSGGSMNMGDTGMLADTNVSDRVFFAYDSSTLDSSAQATLRAQADWLNNNPAVDVTLEGHADERGTREYNLALGERRANAAKNYLVSLGVDRGRITVVSYGKERPAVLGHDEAAWAQNRRAVTVIAN